MQDFQDIPADTKLRDSRPLILNRDESLISNFAGGSFPAQHLTQGMLCYRTDENKLYTLINPEGPSWHLLADLDKTSTNQEALDSQLQSVEVGLNKTIASQQQQLLGALERIQALEEKVVALERKKLNIFAQDIEGIEITERSTGDELTLQNGQFVNRKRIVSATEPANPREGDWWVRVD